MICIRINNKGYTLVQLIAVIAIIVVLSTLLIDGIPLAMAKAKAAKCANNLRQIYQAMMMYMEDHHDRFPDAKGLDEKDFEGLYLKDILVPEYASEEIFYCPCDPRPYEEKRKTGSYDWNTYFRGKTFSEIENKADVILVGDFRSTWHWAREHFLDWLPDWAGGTEKRKINVIFADGHIEYLSEKEWQENLEKYKKE